MMIEAIALGILQGITEFLPVSSSGHVFYAGRLYNYPVYDLPLMLSIHIATAMAVFVYFRHRIRRLFISIVKTRIADYADERKLIKYLLIASIPAGIAGFLLEPFIDRITTVYLVGTCWIINGMILIIGEILIQKKNTEKHLNAAIALFIGVFQALSILPGISRSGSTITAARNAGMKSFDAFEFSFLLGIIAIVGGFILELLKKPQGFNFFCFVSGLAAFISGYISLIILAKTVRQNKMKWFGLYTIVVGLLTFFYK